MSMKIDFCKTQKLDTAATSPRLSFGDTYTFPDRRLPHRLPLLLRSFGDDPPIVPDVLA
jgi:hypothetical protein